ncbi:hypothetical protein ACFUJR_07260 [Streptomyces sp. NPDC057271]|uniref:hypothetical protein n=1 Tax=unclassified Streptomyces TaxID=2593676 RepID=UPI00363B9C22
MTDIPPTTARYVLSAFGAAGGWRPGSFTEALISLLARADQHNAAKLANEYPAEAAAVRLAKYDENGIAKLQKIAAGQVAA